MTVERPPEPRESLVGGVPRPVMRFDDPNHRWSPVTGLRVRGDRFYFNLGDQQSDIWMAEIAGSR